MQIKQLSNEGVPKVRIASHLGVSRSTVYNHLGGRAVKAPEETGLETGSVQRAYRVSFGVVRPALHGPVS